MNLFLEKYICLYCIPWYSDWRRMSDVMLLDIITIVFCKILSSITGNIPSPITKKTMEVYDMHGRRKRQDLLWAIVFCPNCKQVIELEASVRAEKKKAKPISVWTQPT